MFLTDTHAHIHMKPLKYDMEDILKRADENNIKRILTIGIDAKDSINAVNTAATFKEVYATVGVHPHDAEQFDRKDLGTFEDLVQKPKVLAVGEVGLDFYRNRSPKDKQIEVFSLMIDMAVSSKLPLILHVREAAEDCINVLENMLGDTTDHPILFHCFSGDQLLIDWGLNRKNCMYSFAGNVTYPKALQLHEALDQLPLERLFIETDCPYLAPVPFRGKQNEPSYLPHTARYVADAKKISVDKAAEQFEINFKGFFKV